MRIAQSVSVALLALLVFCLSATAATTKVLRYAYTISVPSYTAMPYVVDPSTGRLRFAAEQSLSGPCDGQPYGDPFTISPSQKFAYIVTSCGQVVAAGIATNGTLTPINGSPFAIGTSIQNLSFTPSGKFAYTFEVSAYPTVSILPIGVKTTTGALTLLSGSASYSGSTSIPSMIMDPGGKFLFVWEQSSSANIYVFAINTTNGALTMAPGSPFSAGGGTYVTSVAAYAGGTSLIATNYQNRSVSVLKVNRTTGVLTLAPGSPYTTRGYPYSVAVDPVSPHFVFVGYAGFDSNISVFRLNAKGQLTEVAGSPFQTLGGNSESQALQSDPTGHYLYSLTSVLGGTVEQVLTVNASTGTLTPVQSIAIPFTRSGNTPQLTFTTGTVGVSFTPTYAYAANSPSAPSNSQDGIVEFSINPTTGSLTEGSVTSNNTGPQQLLLSPQNNSVYYTDSQATGGYFIQAGGGLQALTGMSVSGTAILEDPDSSFFYVGAGPLVGEFDLSQSGMFGGEHGSFSFTGNVVGLATSAGIFADYVVTDNSALWSIFRGSNTGAKYGPSSPGTIGNSPSAISTDGAGRFVYVTNSADNTISGVLIGSGSSFTPLSGSAFAAGTTPSAIVGDPYGVYLYVANSGSKDVWAYSIDQATGNLTQIGSPVSVGNGPVSLNIDYSGKFLYCANSGDGTVSTFTINADGTLTPSGTVTVDPTTPSMPAPTSIVSTGTYN